MAAITIRGHSDDIISLSGAVEDEFALQDVDEGDLLAFSDGTLLRVLYDNDGMWRINRLHQGKAKFDKKDAAGPDDDRYSDVVRLTGEIAWAVHGVAFRTAICL